MALGHARRADGLAKQLHRLRRRRHRGGQQRGFTPDESNGWPTSSALRRGSSRRAAPTAAGTRRWVHLQDVYSARRRPRQLDDLGHRDGHQRGFTDEEVKQIAAIFGIPAWQLTARCVNCAGHPSAEFSCLTCGASLGGHPLRAGKRIRSKAKPDASTRSGVVQLASWKNRRRVPDTLELFYPVGIPTFRLSARNFNMHARRSCRVMKSMKFNDYAAVTGARIDDDETESRVIIEEFETKIS